MDIFCELATNAYFNGYICLNILSNEKYAGDALFQKRFTPPVLPLMQRKNNGELPKYYVQNTHEAIIDKETFNLVQEKLKENTERNAKFKSRNNIFAGKLYCAYCNRSFKIKYVNGESYYACSKNKVSEEKCLSHSMSEEVIGRTFMRMNRSIQVEGAFGVLKEDYAFRRFLTGGKHKTQTQFLLLSFAFNIQKLCNRLNFGRFHMPLFEKMIA